MAEVLTLSYRKAVNSGSIRSIKTTDFYNMKDIVSYLFSGGRRETDADHATVIILDTLDVVNDSGLDSLNYEDKALLLKFFFNHLNLIIIKIDLIEDKKSIEQLNIAIDKISMLIKSRITRVETWTGTGNNQAKAFYTYDRDIRFEINDIVATMLFTVNINLNKSSIMVNHLIQLKELIIQEIDFESLLYNHSPSHFSKLCYLVGHWAFPAHELTNDDLVYCVYIMISYALKQIQVPIHVPSKNEMLCFIFMVRDSYKCGNQFHNFRHAVDVLQACFHFLIRLGSLPKFKQLQESARADETKYLFNQIELDSSTELASVESEADFSMLSYLQSFGLLIAALGHDVGHPGVTNAFLVKYSSPASLIYNERSVLESFHTSIFINKVLAINWPNLLSLSIDADSSTTLKDLIISSILATDMAEHFEYINKLKKFNYKTTDHVDKIKLISSLLIKCADISNVTRPLRVSSQWALALSREFDEILVLEKKLNNQLDSPNELNIAYDELPSSLAEILEINPNLHKGQIFFITTFAEKLFNNIVELLPELRFTTEIIAENKSFWKSRSQKQ